MSRSRQILREFIGARNEVEYHKLQFNDASAIVTAGERALSQADNELIVAELKLKKAEENKSSPIFIQSLQHELNEAEAAKSIAEVDLFCMQRRLLPYRKELEKSEAAKESLENKMRFALKSVVVASVHEAEVAVSLGFGNNIFASTKMDSCDRNDLRREVRVKFGVSIRLLVVGLFDFRWETTQSARA